VEALRPLYAALERMPPDPEAASGVPSPSGFFALRHWIGGHAPALLLRLGPVEAWQVVGVVLVVLAGWLLGHLGGWPAVALLRWATAATLSEAARIRWPARLATASALWLAGSGVLGLPEMVRATLHLLFTTTLALAAAWAGWHVVDAVARHLAEGARRTSTQVDEIMVSLTAGVAKVALVVGATGLGLDGIEVEFTAYLSTASLAAERAARVGVGGCYPQRTRATTSPPEPDVPPSVPPLWRSWDGRSVASNRRISPAGTQKKGSAGTARASAWSTSLNTRRWPCWSCGRIWTCPMTSWCMTTC
jgi:hypothetical protein